jgi:alanyl-tRNA synthetase
VQAMTVDELREAYLAFFEERGHLRLASASLMPHGDPTLLLTAAGMVPFKPYFVGKEVPPKNRITTCQRCLRTPDIEHVGRTDRHGTFFEMLGNFSFGDYFKLEAIGWSWDFVTRVLGMEPALLWVTVYLDDDEAAAIWRDKVGVPADRIVRLGKDDNFWGIGVGPCGPCSEIYVDRGAKHGCGRPECRPGCDCERFMEVWNLVFIQYHQDEQGELHPLAKKGIDTGMGLERTAAMLQGVSSIFDTDLVRPIVDHVAGQAGVRYGESPQADVSLRVICDHMRGVTFMVLDGILPGNDGRGYVLRRLLRRAVRHARLLGIKRDFLCGVVDVVVEQMRVGYPELPHRAAHIKRVVALEEERFHATLDQGMEILERLIEGALGTSKEITGDDAFRLHDTYGFPFELTEEIAADRGVSVDKTGFEAAMERQRERARAARTELGYLGEEKGIYAGLSLAPTVFVGYDSLTCDTEVVALMASGEQVGRLSGSGAAEVVLAATPFYAESGGQVGDTGVIEAAAGLCTVESTIQVGNGLIVHRGRFSGDLHLDDAVKAKVFAEKRRPTQRNHTATHLLHKALHEIVGEHANQAGSLVAPDRLRFDFTHFEPLSAAVVQELEERVNSVIWENLPVKAVTTDYEAAIGAGAMALFGEKYGSEVRMVQVGDYSRELCGGTHVGRTGEIGLFRVISEGGVASGVRRIEAVTGEGAFRFVREEAGTLAAVAERLQAAPRDVPKQLDKLLLQVKELEREVGALKSRLVANELNELTNTAETVDGVKVLAAAVDGLDMDGLCALGDRLKERLGACALALGSHTDERVQLVLMATPEAVARGVNANELIRKVAPLVGGGGGGSPAMARAGGKHPGGLAQAMAAAGSALTEKLRGHTANAARR